MKMKLHTDVDSDALVTLIGAAYADIKARLDLERFIVDARTITNGR